jgi:hypothetical protein
LPDGYLVPSDKEAVNYIFLKPGLYDERILEFANRNKEPVTLWGDFGIVEYSRRG